jgi:hypothetical protein
MTDNSQLRVSCPVRLAGGGTAMEMRVFGRTGTQLSVLASAAALWAD